MPHGSPGSLRLVTIILAAALACSQPLSGQAAEPDQPTTTQTAPGPAAKHENAAQPAIAARARSRSTIASGHVMRRPVRVSANTASLHRRKTSRHPMVRVASTPMAERRACLSPSCGFILLLGIGYSGTHKSDRHSGCTSPQRTDWSTGAGRDDRISQVPAPETLLICVVPFCSVQT